MFRTALAELDAASGEGVAEAFSYMREADISFLNCEMPLTRRGYAVEKTVNIRSDPAVAKDLADTLGADVVTLANNHMLDYSYEGLFDTFRHLDDAGIARVGAGRDLRESLKPSISEVNGLRFGFLGVAATLPPGSAADDTRPGIAPIRVDFSFAVNTNLMAENPGIAPIVRTHANGDDVAQVVHAVSDLKQYVDVIVVGIHWGITRRRITPFQGMIADYQGPLGRALIDAGADLVVGNHSHNLHGVEVYRGKPIFYSLGNLIFQDPKDYMEPESLIVLADFGKAELRVCLVPVLVNDGGFPEVVEGAEAAHVYSVLRERSEPFGTQFVESKGGLEVVLD